MVTHHRRMPGGIATHIIVNGPIVMAPPGISISMDELYPRL